VVEHASHVVEYLAHIDAAADQVGVGFLDVEDHEVQTLNGAGTAVVIPVPKMIGFMFTPIAASSGR
jgi:hypothetical protein